MYEPYCSSTRRVARMEAFVQLAVFSSFRTAPIKQRDVCMSSRFSCMYVCRCRSCPRFQPPTSGTSFRTAQHSGVPPQAAAPSGLLVLFRAQGKLLFQLSHKTLLVLFRLHPQRFLKKRSSMQQGIRTESEQHVSVYTELHITPTVRIFFTVLRENGGQ